MLYLILKHNRPFTTYKDGSGVFWRFKRCIRVTSYYACVAEMEPKPLKVWPGQLSAGMGVTQNENYRLLITHFKFFLRASNTQLSFLWAWVIRFRLTAIDDYYFIVSSTIWPQVFLLTLEKYWVITDISEPFCKTIEK